MSGSSFTDKPAEKTQIEMNGGRRLDFYLSLYSQANQKLIAIDSELQANRSLFLALAALCLPLLVSGVVGDEAEHAIEITSYCIIASYQVLFYVFFFALMQVRSRNIACCYLRYYAERINATLEPIDPSERPVPMMNGGDNEFYLKDKAQWFGSYVLAAVPIAVLFIWGLWYVWSASAHIGPFWALLAFELVAVVLLVIFWTQTTAEKRFRDLKEEACAGEGKRAHEVKGGGL